VFRTRSFNSAPLIQKFLGHHSILTTARYTHLTDQTKHHAIDRINGLMDGFSSVWGQAK
jgi:integrase